jgi:quercetin dioxygenase-like cupin family protein
VGATVGFVEILAGQANPLHVHADCSEILVLLEGSLSHVVGEETVELVAGDVLVVPPGMVHRAANNGTATARMVVVYDSGLRTFEVVG